VGDFLNSSGGQVVLAEIVMAAAGAFAARGAAGGGAGETIGQASARLTHACTEAVRAFRAALDDESFRHDVADAADEPEAAEPEVIESGAKKKRGPRREELESGTAL
jgi:hypothetical protein